MLAAAVAQIGIRLRPFDRSYLKDFTPGASCSVKACIKSRVREEALAWPSAFSERLISGL